jgi:hypothetical protein
MMEVGKDGSGEGWKWGRMEEGKDGRAASSEGSLITHY